jgi:hypothetical protein
MPLNALRVNEDAVVNDVDFDTHHQAASSGMRIRDPGYCAGKALI